MRRDCPAGEPDTSVAWGSDVAAQMLRRLGYRYVSLNPGASFRGLHDSLVNHLGNIDPSILLCVHEDHAVGIAHGYAKATGEPMACVLHSNVGLMHGMMALYNAWCDRMPMFVLGGTGPMDAAKRRPWVDWTHTSANQGGMIRDFVKFDDQPSSPEALVETMCRADIATRSLPSAPVYVCLDAGLQEARLNHEPAWPDPQRMLRAEPAHAGPAAMRRIAEMLRKAQRPLLLLGRGGRSQEAWNRRIALAERVGACVMTDLRTGAVFPTGHPAHVSSPMANASAADRGLIAEADLVLAFDWCDLGGTLSPPGVEPPACPVVTVSLDEALHNGAHMNYQALPAADVRVAAAPDAVVAQLTEVLGAGARSPWRAKPAPQPVDRSRLSVRLIGAVLREAVADPAKIALASVCRGWPCDLWPFGDPAAYHGKDGGGGIGASPSLAVGVALALNTEGRQTIAAMGDGDFIMGGHALWTAVHHRIPVLILVNNNRSYFNDELHQEAVARRRGRAVENRWIGQALTDPEMDLAGFARMQGAVGIGPVKSPEDVRAAIDAGLEALAAGQVCVIDFHVDPGAERPVHATGARGT